MLLISDSEHDEILFRQALASSGLRLNLNRVRTTPEAIALLKGAPPFADPKTYLRPSLIIVDLSDPGSAATELLLYLQNKPEFKDIATVIIKHATDPESVNRAYSLGATSVVTKPQDPQELLTLYSSLCQFWSLREAPVLGNHMPGT